MKKTNITDGKWEVSKFGTNKRVGVKVYDGLAIRVVCKFDGIDEWKENAQAISAVPEMIDELIYTNRLLRHQLKSLEWLDSQNVDIGKWVENQRELIYARIKSNEKAIKKAGCEL